MTDGTPPLELKGIIGHVTPTTLELVPDEVGTHVQDGEPVVRRDRLKSDVLLALTVRIAVVR